MTLKINRSICLLAVLVLALCSCGSKDTVSTVEFPVSPDKIVVGFEGGEKEIFPEDEAFDEIVSSIIERTNKSDNFGTLRLADHDPDSGKHLSYDLRKSETFVEFIYSECKPQSFNMLQSGGGASAEEIDVQRLFFALSGEYHDCFFIGKDVDYVNTATIGMLTDNTALVTYVRNLVSQDNASE